MEQMISQLSEIVEDLKVERRYALSALAGRRIREATDAVEQAKRLVTAAVNAGESDVRRRMGETLLSRAALRAEAVEATVAAKADRLAEAYIQLATDAVEVAKDAVREDDYYANLAAEDAIEVDYAAVFDD